MIKIIVKSIVIFHGTVYNKRTGVLKKLMGRDCIMTSKQKDCISAEPFLHELKKITKKNYCKDTEFIKNLSDILLRETGSDNLGLLCREIINF